MHGTVNVLKHQTDVFLNVLSELPGDCSSAIEKCSNAEGHLLNQVLFDWRLFIAILREHCNGHGYLGRSLLSLQPNQNCVQCAGDPRHSASISSNSGAVPLFCVSSSPLSEGS